MCEMSLVPALPVETSFQDLHVGNVSCLIIASFRRDIASVL